MDFRLLEAEEIEVRISTLKDNGCSVLLYKDARVDQNILDETVGAMNWQRHHCRDNANCIVSIWDESKKQWIDKEDTGKESHSEAEKGLASDSFKRACFNWGIGRELYTAPFIWIAGSFDKYSKFKVGSIAYDENRRISDLTITDVSGKTLWGMNKSGKKTTPANSAKEDIEYRTQLIKYIADVKMSTENVAKICKYYKVNKITELTGAQAKDYLDKAKESSNE